MTDERALIAAIAADPDDDTVRLAYADFLEENGGDANAARAEFIRAQIRLARLGGAEVEAEQLRIRLEQLLRQWEPVWQREMPAGFQNLPDYRRGFAYRAVANASAIPAAVDDSRTLLIEELELTVDVPRWRLREVVAHPLFPRLIAWRVKSDLPIGFTGARLLAEGEYPRLERLSLARLEIGNIGLKALCESWGFPRLRELALGENRITDVGAEILLNSHLAARLRHVSLGGNEISWAMMQRLSERFGSTPIWT